MPEILDPLDPDTATPGGAPPEPALALPPGEFARRLIAWRRQHGRHGLPWQGSRDPYRVWLSEVMLQQTQATTVVPYYQRFLQHFPDVQTLAGAALDEVLGLWSGLGYYARARNLHRCAQQVVQQHGGHFPQTAARLQALPGIGPSTAAAIAAFCFGERRSILDGNARRVLARVLAFDGDLGKVGARRALLAQAERLLPVQDLQRAMPAYTQGLMDLGSMVCLPRAPACQACPLRICCAAAATGQQQRYPVRAVPRPREQRHLWLLQARDERGSVWLQRRPDRGIWAGLHCLPVFGGLAALQQVLPAPLRTQCRVQPSFEHVLTHRLLQLQPVQVQLCAGQAPATEGRWVAPDRWQRLGLPAPVRRLLEDQRER